MIACNTLTSPISIKLVSDIMTQLMGVQVTEKTSDSFKATQNESKNTAGVSHSSTGLRVKLHLQLTDGLICSYS